MEAVGESQATKPVEPIEGSPKAKPAKATEGSPTAKPAKAVEGSPTAKPVEALGGSATAKPAKAVEGSPKAKPAKVIEGSQATKPAKPIEGSPPVTPEPIKGGVDTFDIDDWTGYPDAPRPEGPFRILEGDEYDASRKLANKTNANIHAQRPDLAGIQIHEMHPVKLGGSPTDIDNKIALSPKEHARYTAFWNKVLREQKKASCII